MRGSKLFSIFKRPKYVVEVSALRNDQPRPTREAFEALWRNPIFQYLLGRLRAQNSGLKANIATNRFDDLKDLAFVQSGIYWTGWLERDISQLMQAPPKPELPPIEAEEEEFRKIDTLLERVGIEPPQAD